MKIQCTQENLIKGLYIVSHIAGKNISLPILNNILIKVDNGLINLISTNLDIGIKTLVRGKVEKGGELTIQAKLFYDYISLLKPGSINLEKDKDNLKIKAENQESVIKGQEAEDYPIIPEIEEFDGFLINGKDFREILSQVVFSASYDEIRPELSGVLFKISDNNLVLVATDSYRLAEKKFILKKEKGVENISKIVPLRVLQEILRILGESEGEIKIGFKDNQIIFKFDETIIISRLIEGNYPDYKEIIPDKYNTKVMVENKEFLKAIKTASLFSKAGINDVFLEFNKKNGEIQVSSANVQLGENKATIKGQIEGENNNVIFNHKYLIDGLQNIQSRKIRIEINSSDMPVVLRPEEGDDYLYLIMPIRK